MTNEGQRRLVLTEEDYTSKLSSIVARDFFPDISKLERQNALLDRRLEGDLAGAIAVRRATRRMIHEEETAAAKRKLDDHDVIVETTSSIVPRSNGSNTTIYNGRPIRKRPRPLADESLTGFVARATNEDDHEFDSHLKREIKEKRKRTSEFFESSNTKNTKETPNLHLEMASDDFAPESNRIEWKDPAARNSLFFNPTPILPPSRINRGGIHNKSKLIEGAVGESSLETEETRLMPPPSEQKISTIACIQKAEIQNAARLAKSELVEYIPKNNLEKKIQPSATRFPTKGSELSTIRNSNGNGIIGEEIDSASDSDYMSEVSTDLDAPLRPVEDERRCFQMKKQSDRRSYVAMTPQIIPGTGNESPITTWGSIDGTPLVLSGKDEGIERQPSFYMPNTSERESAASKADALMAKRSKLALSSSSKKYKKMEKIRTNRSSSLTPVALSLLEKTKRLQSRSGFVSSLRTSYTPCRPSSSASRKHPSKMRRRDHAYNATPQT